MMNVSGNIYKLERNAIWMLVFYHDINKSDYFKSIEDGKKYFNYTGGMYSILYKLKDYYRIQGKFEFLLEYPKENLSNQWRQRNNPLRQPMIYGKNVTGYEPIDIQMRATNWSGLYKRTENYFSLLSGSCDGRWHYAIGVIDDHYRPFFPGEYTNSEIVYLWVRVRVDPNKCSLMRKVSVIPKSSILVCVLALIS